MKMSRYSEYNKLKLVKLSKQGLQAMIDEWWNSFFEEVNVFCVKNNIFVPNIDDLYQPRSRRKTLSMKTSYHYCNASKL
jgi:hypothetical protein